MFELLLALAAEPAAQAASTEAPRAMQRGDLTVSNGGMMAWDRGQVLFEVENRGSEADRIVSISTPAGTIGEVVIRMIAERSDPPTDGDLSIRPGRTRVYATLADLASDERQSFHTTVTVVFERAGEFTIQASPVSPAPAPRR